MNPQRQGLRARRAGRDRDLALAGQRPRAREPAEARGDHGRRQAGHRRGSRSRRAATARRLPVNLKAAREAADRAGDPQGAGPDRRQHLRRRQAARDQPADALRPAQAIRAAAREAARRSPGSGRSPLAACSSAAGTPYERGVAAFERGDIRTARVEFLNALQADPRQPRRADHAGAGRSSRSATASPRNRRSSRARQAGVPAGETAPPARPRPAAPGRRPGRAARGGAAPRRAHRRLCRSGSAAAPIMALGDSGERRAPPSTARSRWRPNDSEVWTDVARFRRSNGDLAGALEAADRAVAAAPAQRRGAGAARRADPRPIWPRRRHALVRPRARGRSRQCRRPARARRHLWRHGPDDRHARRRARGASR